MPTGAGSFVAMSIDPVSTTQWSVSGWPVAYADAVAAMQARAAAIADGTAPESVWLLEHPPLYTAGTSARAADLREARFPVHATGRGGQYTYHGPGQRVAYVMLDLRRRTPDVRAFVATLESWLTATLARFGVRSVRREGRIGHLGSPAEVDMALRATFEPLFGPTRSGPPLIADRAAL